MSETFKSPEDIVDALEALYAQSVSNLKAALSAFLHDGTAPEPGLRQNGGFCYPELIVRYDPDGPPPPISRSFGKMSEAGDYASTVTRPAFFRKYLIEQLTPLMRDYEIEIEVRLSDSEIPYAYVWDAGEADGLDQISPAELARLFPAPSLGLIGDEVADGELFEAESARPLALFDAQRTDFSLKRLEHYTGTP
ncbi:MAG: AMP nucleosidase, partial [Pseudomonadota bacterium]